MPTSESPPGRWAEVCLGCGSHHSIGYDTDTPLDRPANGEEGEMISSIQGGQCIAALEAELTALPTEQTMLHFCYTVQSFLKNFDFFHLSKKHSLIPQFTFQPHRLAWDLR